MLRNVRIASLRTALPEAPLDDAALAAELGCDLGLVASLGRGRTRHGSPDGEGVSHLATRAARAALEELGRSGDDVDMIVFATNTADYHFPGSAVLVQNMLPTPTVGGLDLRSQCTGFLTAVDVASRFVATGKHDRVLVCVGEIYTHMMRMDGTAPELACLAADAAAAVVLEAGEGPGQLLSSVTRVDGRRHKEFWCEYPAGRNWQGPAIRDRIRFTREHFDKGLHFPVADFDAMRRTALEEMPPVVAEACARAGVERPDAVLVAHLHPDIEAELAATLAGVADTVLVPDFVYVGTASLARLMRQVVDAGTLAPGATVALATAGSGASWGCSILKVVQ